MPTVDPIVYRLPALRQAVGLSTTTIYKMINDGDFPRPVQLTSRAVGWPAHEVRAWLDSRPRATGHLAPEDSASD
ncbi:hypothetical protein CAL26_09765 [Bordetella genomosp. 9]|uniref:AlpA family transcriptional regulator n=1 Tax=Bordetella genomosp. 9 TaxID=1416803 RepID=A0A261RF90_9BORD|nr:AlpA family transcriptional regulator [Bordetella genomosp. 9]OZI23708.1 hypothetical protein CAL26_09765 [Bordetella genomosp. 9]